MTGTFVLCEYMVVTLHASPDQNRQEVKAGMRMRKLLVAESTLLDEPSDSPPGY